MIVMTLDPAFWLVLLIPAGVLAIVVYSCIEVSKRHPARTSSPSPAAWYPDPSGRHANRFWDGRAWTSHVADDGRVAVDPLTSAHS
jgi:hypothetical protein